MLKLINLESTTKNLLPVTSVELFVGKSTNFHPDGLFSERIFGASQSSERTQTFSYINLNCKIPHPSLYSVLRRLDKNILSAMSGEKSFIISTNGELIEEKEKPTIKGMSSLIENFKMIKLRGDSQFRDNLIKLLYYYSDKDRLFIDKCLVIPAAYREVDFLQSGEKTIPPINDYYLNIIRMSLQLKSAQKGEVFDILSYRMYQYVLELYDFIRSKIAKKGGLIRGNILGKRVDFSGRAVISGGGSDIKPYEIGVPFKILVKIFEPFIIYELLSSGKTDKIQLQIALKEYDGSILSALSLRRLFISIYKNSDIPKNLELILKEAVLRATKDKIVLAKRDPALHTESIQAFKPKMVDGNTIRLPSCKAGAYNADFDGDQMALYVPVTIEAIKEAKDKMMVTMSKDGIDKISDSFDKDSVIGIYILTRDPPGKGNFLGTTNDLQVILKNDIYDTVKYLKNDTTVGRIIFNSILPQGYPFINTEVNQSLLNKIGQKVYVKYGQEVYWDFADKLIKLSYKYGTLSGISFSMTDLEIPKSFENLKNQIRGSTPQDAQKVISNIDVKLKDYLEHNDSSLGIFGKAGTLKGGYGQTRQVVVCKGLSVDNLGKLLPPIAESYSEGLPNKIFFNSGSGSRRGISDRVLNTSETGYLMRKLIYALQRVEADPKLLDCKTKRFFTLKATEEIASHIHGRYIVEGINSVRKFDPEKDIGKIIRLRSPLYCASEKICKLCYGDLMERNKSQYIGMLAASILGERGTQVIMRTFHTGGAVSIKNVDIISAIRSGVGDESVMFINKNFEQKDNQFISHIPGKLILKKSEYLDPKKDIRPNDSSIDLDYGYFNLKFDDKTIIPITLDTKTILHLQGQKSNKIDKEEIVIEFKENIPIFSCPGTSDNFHDKVKIIKHVLSGKKPWRSPDHFCLKIYDLYSNSAAYKGDLVHIEVLAGHLLRDKGNPSFPARLNPIYNPIVININDIPKYESWLSGMSFERFDDSVITGLMYERETSSSILEHVVTGEL